MIEERSDPADPVRRPASERTADEPEEECIEEERVDRGQPVEEGAGAGRPREGMTREEIQEQYRRSIDQANRLDGLPYGQPARWRSNSTRDPYFSEMYLVSPDEEEDDDEERRKRWLLEEMRPGKNQDY